MSWYRTGTIAVTNGSTTVTGTGTDFIDAVPIGSGLVGPDGRVYDVVSRASASTLTLGSPYLGSTASGQAYAVFPTRDLGTLPDQLQAVISAMQATIDGAGAGKFGDGTAATPGLRFAADADTGLYRPAANQIGLAAGGVQRALLSGTDLNVSVPITGTAVTQTAADATAGRLLKVGDFGLGGGAASYTGSVDATTVPTGHYFAEFNSTGTKPGGATVGYLTVYRHAAGDLAEQQWTTGAGLVFRRVYTAGAWTAWDKSYSQTTVLGVVSQSAGVPTGAVIESGSNANGRYTKFASGLMECRRTMNAASGAAVTWTFPAAFIEGPVVTGNAVATVLSTLCFDAAPTITAVTFSARDKTDARRADVVHLHAVGRWSTMV